MILELEVPDDVAKFRLPEGVEALLHDLLDKQSVGNELTSPEQREAEGLVNLAEFLNLLRLRSENAAA